MTTVVSCNAAVMSDRSELGEGPTAGHVGVR